MALCGKQLACVCNGLKLQVATAHCAQHLTGQHQHPRPHLTRAGTLKTINSDKYRILLGQLGGDVLRVNLHSNF
jgi:hypothetical protein